MKIELEETEFELQAEIEEVAVWRRNRLDRGRPLGLWLGRTVTSWRRLVVKASSSQISSLATLHEVLDVWAG